MDFKWEALDNGYRAQIKVDLGADAMVYTSNCTMAKLNPLPPLTKGMQAFGDLSSANVIVGGHPGKYILAGAVTAFRSLTMLRAVFEQRRLVLLKCGSLKSNQAKNLKKWWSLKAKTGGSCCAITPILPPKKWAFPPSTAKRI